MGTLNPTHLQENIAAVYKGPLEVCQTKPYMEHTTRRTTLALLLVACIDPVSYTHLTLPTILRV